MSRNRSAVDAGELAFWSGLPRFVPSKYTDSTYYWYLGYDGAKEEKEKQDKIAKLEKIFEKLDLDHDEVQLLKEFFNE